MIQDKTIGYKHRIPAIGFAEALRDFLRNGSIDSKEVDEIVAGYFSGDYVRRGASQHIVSCIKNSELAEFFSKNSTELLNAVKNQQEAFYICFALLCVRFSFCYNIAVEMAKLFRMQDTISKDAISRQIANKYGYNENVKRPMERFLAFCEDAKIIKRPSNGVFENMPKLNPSEVTLELWKQTYLINEPMGDVENIDELPFEPFFRYLNLLPEIDI